MTRSLLVPLALSFLGISLAAVANPEVAMTRLSDGGAVQVSVVQASEGTGAAATIVTLIEGPRGGRLFLRRSRTPSGTVLHEMWLGSPPVVAFTRGGGEGIFLELGGLSLRFYEADLELPTVRCWIGALVSKVEPKLVEIAATLRLLKSWAGEQALGDVFYPATVLWKVADAPDARSSGPLKVDRGPFKGEPWDRLADAALQAIGRR
jgi:hypothetical protein